MVIFCCTHMILAAFLLSRFTVLIRLSKNSPQFEENFDLTLLYEMVLY